MISVIVNGALGKMGQLVVETILNAPDLNLVAKADRDDNLEHIIKESAAQVIVDFTHPTSGYDNAQTILNSKCHAVIGTTGLTDPQLKELDKLAQQNNCGILVCPNFAIGAVLMMKYSAEIGKYMTPAEIIEYHHEQKVDAPSGTAIKTAEMIPHQNKIPIHSVRLPGIIANQDVIFGGMGQTLTISHQTTHRSAFMPGVLMGIRKVSDLVGLVYGLENIL